jgi:ferredoxin
MAVLKTATAQADVNDGELTQEAAKELGVTFGCRKGVCGACVVEVLEGMENLSAKSGNEEGFDLRANDRMMCQCSITSGSVTIKG